MITSAVPVVEAAALQFEEDLIVKQLRALREHVVDAGRIVGAERFGRNGLR